VGGPSVNVEFKVVDVAEMNYTSKDKDQEGNLVPRGEVWIRGPGVFQGYYKDEEKTKEALTEDGWLRTGDIGQINPNGSLKLIDRKKNIFKLS
jgi:long-chain acyl-CoA synthetase